MDLLRAKAWIFLALQHIAHFLGTAWERINPRRFYPTSPWLRIPIQPLRNGFVVEVHGPRAAKDKLIPFKTLHHAPLLTVLGQRGLQQTLGILSPYRVGKIRFCLNSNGADEIAFVVRIQQANVFHRAWRGMPEKVEPVGNRPQIISLLLLTTSGPRNSIVSPFCRVS